MCNFVFKTFLTKGQNGSPFSKLDAKISIYFLNITIEWREFFICRFVCSTHFQPTKNIFVIQTASTLFTPQYKKLLQATDLWIIKKCVKRPFPLAASKLIKMRHTKNFGNEFICTFQSNIYLKDAYFMETNGKKFSHMVLHFTCQR
ncbi:hypothetical protein T4B_3197 [Trichinella pseudospiralis]|uniref:Uncharacterized protein n=1 Tax=Trichinella pseudospiralis TaxID=6337 RepID=A0A0V1EPQ7_TRIPS|nr:hypothetical protein T4A_8432 [Trichinella pseudospiralis]KRZ19888.1 hypothetical protein T4B_3197 [Trichinella pseudospiralis]KRZ43401.1 hypothetical protein T4C_11945 [Trichinella pseudospiralis]